MQLKRVVITGLGAISPLGVNFKNAWTSLLLKKSAITKLEGPEFELLPCRVAGLIKSEDGNNFSLADHFNKSDLKTMSKASAYAILAAKEALQDANLEKFENDNEAGVAIGMGVIDLSEVCAAGEAFKRGPRQISPFFVPSILPNMAAGQISMRWGLRGPNHSASTACAAGAHAIGDSFHIIARGDANLMVCGGAEACISPLAIAAFCRLRALSTEFNDKPEESSRPFDKRRDGFVMGEGAAVLILEELEHALSRNAPIYAEVLGYGMSGDASHLTAPSPEGTGAILAIQRALRRANLDPKQVSYVNAHATSTPIGDGIEAKAIKSVFGDHSTNLAVSSTKGAHGHLLGAAGALESAFTINAIKEGILPPNVNLENSDISGLNFITDQNCKWQTENDRRIAVKNSFGFGGTNASLCFAEFVK